MIEVLAPSNTKAEMHEKAVLCLSTGALEYWVVDPRRKTVSVTTQSGAPVVYQAGERIPLAMFDSALVVSDIFS
jgi:Uma2 family endonuclease